jgi:hypothetical protein
VCSKAIEPQPWEIKGVGAMADGQAAVEPGKPGQDGQEAKTADSVTPLWAGWFGVALTIAALAAFLFAARSLQTNSLGFTALAGVTVLSISVTALILLSRAMGLSDASAALGLPPGSIRALLALGLAIVFVAVASWALGGVFDPVGRLVAQTTVPVKERESYLQRYVPAADYVVFDTPVAATPGAGGSNDASAMTELKVFIKHADQNLVDLAKQILTISATVLVTIIGFYFGSNSATDAARTVKDALTNISGSVAKSNEQDTPQAPASGEPQKVASTIAAMAAATKAKLQALGPDPTALLHEAVTGAGAGSDLLGALTTVRDQLAILNSKASACMTDRDRAKETADSVPANADIATLKQAGDRLQQLMDDATSANHDFEQAFAKFADARDTILRKTAKG